MAKVGNETLVIDGPHMNNCLDIQFTKYWDGVRGHLNSCKFEVEFTHKVHVLFAERMYMAFCPLDYRYGCQDFKHIWSELGRHERQLEVERALIWAHMKMGKVSESDYKIVESISNSETVTKERC